MKSEIKNRVLSTIKAHRKIIKSFENRTYPFGAFDSVWTVFILDSNVKSVLTKSSKGDESSVVKIPKGKYRFTYTDRVFNRHFALELSDIRELRKLMNTKLFSYVIQFKRC